MRINVPNDASTQLFNTQGRTLTVDIDNVGNFAVWISDQQILLDGSVDPVTNIPSQGLVLNPGDYRQNVLINGQRWARAVIAGAQIEVVTTPVKETACSCGGH